MEQDTYFLFLKEAHKPENMKRTYNIAWDALVIYVRILQLSHDNYMPVSKAFSADDLKIPIERIVSAKKLLQKLKLITFADTAGSDGKFCTRYVLS